MGRRRGGPHSLFVYRYFCSLCGEDEFETVPDTTAQQVLDHADAHGKDLISVWQRPADGLWFSDHFVGPMRNLKKTPWIAANSAFRFVKNVFPDAIQSTDSERLCCRHVGCDFSIKPKNGLNVPSVRTVVYGALARHECVCKWNVVLDSNIVVTDFDAPDVSQQ